MKIDLVRQTLAALTMLAGSTQLLAQPARTPASPSAAAGSVTEETVVMERMVTTGTRLGTASAQGDIPVVVIGRAQLEQTPAVEVSDYLRKLPAFTGGENLNDSFTNGGTGERFVDLRGLGSEYTLVLLNGRRLSFSGVDNAVDVNQIPVAAVDRIEVLTTGASAVYGSDAIGGVINVITRRGESGGEINAFYGDAEHTSLDRRQFAFSVGGAEGRIDFLVGGQYYQQNGIYSDEFDFSRKPGPTGNTFPYRLSLPHALFTPGATGNGNYVVRWKPGEGGRRAATSRADFRPYQGTLPNVENPDAGGDMFPFHLYTPLLRPEERHNVFAFTNYNLNDNLRVFADVMYRYAFSYNELAPAAVSVPAAAAIVIPATNYYNQQIFGADARDIVAGGWRLLGLGPRLDTAEVTGVWFNTGVEGNAAEWEWKLVGTFSQELRTLRSGNSGDLAKLNQFLARSTPDAFNPFVSTLDANARFWDEIRADAFTHERSRIVNLAAQANGTLFELPAGNVNSAFSLEWQKLRAYSRPDALTRAGPLGFNGTPNATEGSRTQWGLTAEAELPLVRDRLSLRVAARYDEYSDFGDVVVGQAALRYQPGRDVVLRASYGEGFVAPSVLQLYEGEQLTNPTFIDPTARTPQGTWGATSQVALTRIGNPSLEAEEAEMANVGVAWSPRAVRGLTLSADFWYVKQSNVISTADDYARIVAHRFWEALGPNDAARDAAARNPATLAAVTAQIEQQTGVAVLWEPNGGPAGLGGLSENDIAMRNVYRTNLAGRKTDGVDLSVDYRWETQSAGSWGVDVKATYTNSFEYQALAGEPFEQLAGRHSSAFEGLWPKWRYTGNLHWNFRQFGAVATYHYVDEVKLQDGFDTSYGRDHLPAWKTWDFQFSYRLPWNTVVAVGVENATAEPPPQTHFAMNNDVPAGGYDVRGRFYYARLSYRF